MFLIGLIKEGKIPADNRVALTPKQCRWIQENMHGIKLAVQSCTNRCFSDKEYRAAGIEVREDLQDCDLLLGIKEVLVDFLIEGKRYMFFSHIKKSSRIIKRCCRQLLKRE
ncbi:MAG: hypothetical protein WKG06_31130 [Segetibacter sp.]